MLLEFKYLYLFYILEQFTSEFINNIFIISSFNIKKDCDIKFSFEYIYLDESLV